MTHFTDFDKKADITAYAWYIEGARKHILVDAGASLEIMRTRAHDVESIQTVEDGLGQFGLSADDIDITILTHMHHDHLGYARDLANAHFVVQSDELEFALDPHPLEAVRYVKELFVGLDFEVVRGWARIDEDITVMPTPGHTPGGQSVLVSTSQGLVAITGFCCIKENFEPPQGNSAALFIIPGGHVSATDAYDSMIKIKRIADIIIPLHDSEFMNVKTVP